MNTYENKIRKKMHLVVLIFDSFGVSLACREFSEVTKNKEAGVITLFHEKEFSNRLYLLPNNILCVGVGKLVKEK